MKPSPFVYHRPDDAAHAFELLGELGDDAKVLAGGQSLVPLLALRLASPAHLVDIGHIAAFGALDVAMSGSGVVVVGANVTQRGAELDARVAAQVPLLADALPLIAHPQIRNRGTVCGSIAHADPAAELPAVAVALDATMVARSCRGERRIAASDFFVSYLDTALAPDEMLVAVEFACAPRRSGAAFREISRRHGDFAVVGVAVSVTLGDDMRMADVRVVFSGVGPVPVRADAGERTLRGNVPSDEVFAAAARDATSVLDPSGDIHATADYRTHVAGVLVQRALRVACERAAGAASQS